MAMPDGRVCVHGTAVALNGTAVLLLGPARSGKSGVAAQMMGMGAGFVCDDLAILSRGPGGLTVAPPDGAPEAMELRGFGIAAVASCGPSRLGMALWLGPSKARMPEPEAIEILGLNLALMRHPATADVAAKALIWLRSMT